MKQKLVPLYYPIKTGLLAIALLFFGCNEDPPVPITNDSAIYGRARDASNYEYDVRVTAIGPYGEESVTANGEYGDYFISSLGNGTYDLEFSKEGFGTMKMFGIQLFGRDTVNAHQVDIYKKPESTKLPTLFEAADQREYNWLTDDALVIKTNWGGDLPPARFFISYDKEVSAMNYHFTLMGGQVNRSGLNEKLYRMSYFYQLGIKSGAKVYLIAYSCNGEDEGYLDPHSGVKVFPTLISESETNVLMVEIP